MEPTVALIFSLGIALSGTPATESDKQGTTHEPTTGPQVVKTLSQTESRRAKHTRIKQRIALTNAWLKQQKLARRQQARAHKQHMDIARAASICTVSWKTT